MSPLGELIADVAVALDLVIRSIESNDLHAGRHCVFRGTALNRKNGDLRRSEATRPEPTERGKATGFVATSDNGFTQIAVASEAGLVVPNIKDADRKGMIEVSRDIAAVAKKARDGKLSMEDLTGGTFTITNGGVFGSLVSTPIINFPQVGILGLHKTQDRPIAVNGQVVIRPMMYVALSYDHRVIDGQQAVLFLVRVKELMEDPAAMLID